MNRTLLLAVGMLLYAQLMAQTPVELNWTVEYVTDSDPDKLKQAEAVVPGAVQLDIAKAEGYSHYYYADNWRDYLWMEDQEFEYVGRFIKPSMENGDLLVFRSLGIDYEFDITFNGTKLLHQEGMFTPVRLDLTPLLMVQNEIRIKIYPIPKKHPLPADRSQASASVKPAVSYGWDWHPRLVPSGIWDDTWVEIVPERHIKEVSLNYSLSEDLDEAYVKAEALGNNLSGCKMAWILSDAKGNMVDMGFMRAYNDRGVLYTKISKPELWWPHDHGPR